MNDLVQPLSEISARPLHWLWHNNLSFGNMSIFDGDPGLGKSLVALDLCARLSTGRPFPGSETAHEPADAIVLNAEDAADNVVLPRLKALGADLSRIHVLRPEFVDQHGGFRLPQHTAPLQSALEDTRARLFLIDPIMAFLDPNVNIGSDQSVRNALAPLLRLAGKYTCVPLLNRHINKMLGTQSIYRGSGSIAFQAACRSSWLFGRDIVHKDRCVMAQVKNNYAPFQPSLAYSVHGQGAAAILEWHGTSNLTGNQLLAAAGKKPNLPGPIHHAIEFLKDGPRPTTEIWPAAEKLGLSTRTLRRARGKAGLEKLRTWTDNRFLTYWRQPGQELPGHVADQAIPDIKKLLQPLIDKYPTTPLDK